MTKYNKEFREYACAFTCPFCHALPDQDCRVMFNTWRQGQRAKISKSVSYPNHHKARLDRAATIIEMEHGP